MLAHTDKQKHIFNINIIKTYETLETPGTDRMGNTSVSYETMNFG